MEYEVLFNETNKPLFKCKVCNKCCDTVEQFNVHKGSRRHINNYRPLHDITLLSAKIQPNLPQSVSKKVTEILRPIRLSNSILCKLCNKSMDTTEQYNIHCSATKHCKKLKTLNISKEEFTNQISHFKRNQKDLEYCKICEITIHSNNISSHKEGKSHNDKVLRMNHLDNVIDRYPRKCNLSEKSENFKNLKFIPRKYQTEIYAKSLNNDCVIFLPTGTGKTFVASMLIVRMLEENPHHRVAFIVDKVLLVMQQHDFFVEQLRNISLKRFDDDDSVSRRPLRIVGLASSYSDTTVKGISANNHDIIVATADLFRGLLTKKQLVWDQFCLVILDEAHHCVKDHSYNKLLQEYHLFPAGISSNIVNVHRKSLYGRSVIEETYHKDWKRRRCKLIGLTASPSGDVDKEKTYLLLLELLKSLGNVEIKSVTENIKELEKYVSNSNIEYKLVTFSKEEDNLREFLQSVFIFMFEKLAERINDYDEGMVTIDKGKLSINNVHNCIIEIENALPEAKDIYKTSIRRILSILRVIITVDTFGYEIAINQLKDLIGDSSEQEWLNQYNSIPTVVQLQAILSDQLPMDCTVIQAILNEVHNPTNQHRTVLLLVKERKTAHEMVDILAKRAKGHTVVLMVGHGAGSSNRKRDHKGMSVNQQKRALKSIKSNKNQIIVATSVAEEGVDLPDCDLVILINPPSSVQALVQVRGRARKKSSRLLMICRDQGSIDELIQLQKKERNIIEAIRRVQSERGQIIL